MEVFILTQRRGGAEKSAEDQATDTLAEDGDVEIDQETEGRRQQPEVGENLSLMDGEEFRDRLQFDDEALFDVEIQAEIAG